ncbi:hypothetical protein [Streptomyces sp. S.PNR 29]|uniref:hypothetical protein n=1 Tax=Streptomyces sp. S.PNR 29 TaxID=2973805 RepID=UPI0025B17508|nr:hypothetical protein [Streptomyces sp. S.PNR 29]MDN0195132.1 hypothetical protein [Streptomyces sp. S.PNR 29]
MAELSDGPYSEDELTDLRRLMTDLLARCTETCDRYASDGEWRPSADGVIAEREEVRRVIADLARALSQTRRGLRRVEDRARQRSSDQGLSLLPRS